MKQIIVSWFLIFSAISLYGQDCPQWPAPCPHNDEIAIAQNVAQREKNNDVLPQEMAMETGLRSRLTHILQTLADKEHWQLYELNESAFDRPNTFIGYTEWEATPYVKRPPHAYYISFIMIVNRDSLAAWRDWYKKDYVQKINQTNSDVRTNMQDIQHDKQLQAYMDSAQHYSQLRIQYITEHQPQFLSDLKANNEKGIKAYNAGSDRYLALYNRFMEKYQTRSDALRSPSTNAFNQLQGESTAKTRTFANASVLLLSFAVNQSQTGYGATDGGQKSLLPQKTLAVPNAFYAGLLQNTNAPTEDGYTVGTYDFAYKNPEYIATILFGAWLRKHTAYNNTPSPIGYDLTSIKKIKCDGVRNMALQMEGRPDYIQQALQGIDMENIKEIVVQP